MYRDELDALNAIYSEQRRTNELLERLVIVKEGGLNASKRRNRGNTGKVTEPPVSSVDSTEDHTN